MWEFDEAVEVRSGVVDGVEAPEQFLWRGRLWRVCSVQAHWIETAAWWERGVIGAGLGATTSYGRTASAAAHTPAGSTTALAPAASKPAPASAGSNPALASAGSNTALAPAGGDVFAAGATVGTAGVSGSPAAVGVLDADWGPQRAVYRVEAGCGRHGRRELFDLAHDPDSGRWQLERVTDR
jgi:uncharacterized protein DUF6504